MDKRILFVDFHNSFVIKGIAQSLDEMNFDVQTIALNYEWLNLNKSSLADTIVFCADDDSLQDKQLISAFCDICIDQNKRIILMGYEDDLLKARNHFLQSIVHEFKRPYNAKEIADKIAKIVDNEFEEDPIKHILVVDDSGTMLNTIKNWLEDKYRISMVNSGFDAIVFLSKTIPDLVLLDYEMPNCSGAQLFEMIRGHQPTSEIPVIFLTAVGEKESVSKVLELKPDGYLLKTMPKEKIVAYIDAFFKNKNV